MGYEVIKAGDIPGFYVKIDTGRPRPEVLILGELDSLICLNYKDADPETACVGSAKWQVVMLSLLLENGAERAKKIISEFKPQFASKKEFLDYIDSINSEGERITYHDDGTATVKLT